MRPGQADYLPLAELVARGRRHLGLSLAGVQRRIQDAARSEGEACGFSRQTISKIEKGQRVPHPDALRWLASALEIPVDIIVDAANRQRGVVASPLQRELRIYESIGWLADHSPLSYEQVYEAIVHRVAQLETRDPSHLHRSAYMRARVPRSRVALALTEYYRDPSPAEIGVQFYQARVGRSNLVLSLLIRPEWLETSIRLGTGDERFRLLTSSSETRSDDLDGLRLDAALDRLAGVEASGNPFVNNPLYRLLGVEVRKGHLKAQVVLADFASYGLSLDLLEPEVVDVLASRGAADHADIEEIRDCLPLRGVYLPSVVSLLDLQGRLCVGGPVALFAAARAHMSTNEPEADFVLLVQERSSKVLNVTGKLAVVPKAFHSPIIEAAAEVSLTSSLARELEEELLGREDLEAMAEDAPQRADPFHYENLSEPMQWIMDRKHTDAVRFECVGFGLNAVTGNYEFPCLIVIDDDEWWAKYGGRIEANWEIKRIRRYSSRDAAGLEALIGAPGWSNEGLFAFIEGLRRLAEVDTLSRVALPTISVEA